MVHGGGEGRGDGRREEGKGRAREGREGGRGKGRGRVYQTLKTLCSITASCRELLWQCSGDMATINFRLFQHQYVFRTISPYF